VQQIKLAYKTFTDKPMPMLCAQLEGRHFEQTLQSGKIDCDQRIAFIINT